MRCLPVCGPFWDFHEMNWKQLLLEEREKKNAGDVSDLRREFEKDYHRIIASASFRRLQDKTQVFPLDKSDFIRTRLTHSLEVSSLGRSLAQNIGAAIIEKQLDPDFDLATKNHLGEVIECAGLIHDIGNPPFGHFGEEAIREWFVRHLPQLSVEGKRLTDLLSAQEAADFYHFEGNAQGLRLVSKLPFAEDGTGLNLTYGLLASTMKYKASSTTMRPDSARVCERKLAYFKAEEAFFQKVCQATGTSEARAPMALILEAADDIAYATADIEDGYKKGFFDIRFFMAEMARHKVPEAYSTLLSELFEAASQGRSARDIRGGEEIDPGEIALMDWLGRMQDVMLLSATENFVQHYKEIMQGRFDGELLSDGPASTLRNALCQIAYDQVFTSMSIYKTEIAANNILTFLLNKLVPSVLQYDADRPAGLMEEKFLSLISENYKQVYARAVRSLSPRDRLYHKLLLATDFVSGMTDSYARDLYTDLNGIR